MVGREKQDEETKCLACGHRPTDAPAVTPIEARKLFLDSLTDKERYIWEEHEIKTRAYRKIAPEVHMTIMELSALVQRLRKRAMEPPPLVEAPHERSTKHGQGFAASTGEINRRRKRSAP